MLFRSQVRREPLGWETLDAGASRAFVVADHQVAHVYVRRPEDVSAVAELLRKTTGIDRVLDRAAQAEFGIDHERSGELVVIAAPESWFTYYFWLDDTLAPDYARTVDIHRKPGYDPVELFVDPKLFSPRLKIAAKLLKKRLGFRTLMDVIPLDASLVRGSHGLPAIDANKSPIWIGTSKQRLVEPQIEATQVQQAILDLLFDRQAS